jgi:hypothetical protein
MDAEDEDEEEAKEEDTDVYGTFEYMSPECYKRDYGVPCFASDVFSFGVILWELWARERVYMGFNGIEDIPDASGKADVSLVPQRMAVLGQRPQIRAEWSCGPAPEPWSKLCSACWQKEVTIRPTFPQIKEVLQRMKDMDGDGWSYVPAAEPEPTEITYEDWLGQLGMLDKKDALAELLQDGAELVELEQMDEDDLRDDILEDGDLALDAEGKANFQDAVAALSGGPTKSAAEPEPEPMVGTEGSAIGNVPWHELCDLLGVQDDDVLEAGKSEDPRLLRLRADLSETSMETVEEVLQEKDERIAALEATVARLQGQPAPR